MRVFVEFNIEGCRAKGLAQCQAAAPYILLDRASDNTRISRIAEALLRDLVQSHRYQPHRVTNVTFKVFVVTARALQIVPEHATDRYNRETPLPRHGALTLHHEQP
jgi:hypothetical protein